MYDSVDGEVHRFVHVSSQSFSPYQSTFKPMLHRQGRGTGDEPRILLEVVLEFGTCEGRPAILPTSKFPRHRL
jgi:hypothetical protein